jgi:hypothetical protein
MAAFLSAQPLLILDGHDGGTGTTTVTVAGSMLEAFDRIIVGAPEAFGGGDSQGTLILANGGTVIANEINLGTGGAVSGSGWHDHRQCCVRWWCDGTRCFTGNTDGRRRLFGTERTT